MRAGTYSVIVTGDFIILGLTNMVNLQIYSDSAGKSSVFEKNKY